MALNSHTALVVHYALLLALTVSFSACGRSAARARQSPLASTVGGTASSKAMVNELRASFLFQAVEMFYDPASNNSARPVLDDKYLKPLAQRLQSLLDELQVHHTRRSVELGMYFNRSLPKRLDVSLDITNSGLPWAYFQGGHVVIDTQVIAGSLAAAMIEMQRSQAEANKQAKQQSDAELLRAGYEVIQRARAIKAKTLIGDLFGDDYLEAASLYEASKELELYFYGTLSFVLAHEMGHAAFGHSGQNCANADSRQQFLIQESQADQYASLLLSESYMLLSINTFNVIGTGADMVKFIVDVENGSLRWKGYVVVGTYPASLPQVYTQIIIPEAGALAYQDDLRNSERSDCCLGVRTWTLAVIDPELLKRFAGYSVFLNKAYELSGFKNEKNQCIYPSSKDRVSNAIAVQDYAIENFSDVPLNVYRERRSRDALLTYVPGTTTFRTILSLVK